MNWTTSVCTEAHGSVVRVGDGEHKVYVEITEVPVIHLEMECIESRDSQSH